MLFGYALIIEYNMWANLAKSPDGLGPTWLNPTSLLLLGAKRFFVFFPWTSMDLIGAWIRGP